MDELQQNIVFHDRHFVCHIGICNPICVRLLQVMSGVIPRNLKKTTSLSNRFPEFHKRDTRRHRHTDTQTHTHTNTYTHTHSHTHTHKHTHIQTHTHTHARTHACTHARTHTRTQTEKPTIAKASNAKHFA